ncbi:aspartyl/asparaginyl beta-hydroxylase-like [Actinia tenebrosa]|uniref:Aspartyl/asparaginyl beta-hydroxylase-like n=1 Tax=Actinia tenebrosa TaxID=6105 RepID=A0A6P8J0Y9_ACTTE|nr:aspartyl/asparaginyl beta-hydroxylase-like [Actinia tenebrosa]
MALPKRKSNEKMNKDDNKAQPEQKRKKKYEEGIPSPLIWQAVILVVVAIFVACIVYNTNLWPKGGKLHSQTDTTQDKQQSVRQEKQTKKNTKTTSSSSKNKEPEKQSIQPKKESSAPTGTNKEARNVADQKPDQFAAITNSYDANISKELKKANNLLVKGKIEDALRRFRGLLDKNPKSPRAHYGKAQTLDKLSEKRQSNELLQEAIDSYAKVPDVLDCPLELKKLALTRMADRLSFFGRLRQAAQTYKKLSELFPDDMGIMNDLGVQYLMYGNNNDAKKIFRKVLKINPNSGFAKAHLGFILKSELKYEESVPLLREGIQSGEPEANDGRFYFHLGDALNRLGKPQEAYEVYVQGANKGIFLSPYQRSLYNADTPLRARPWWKPEETGYIDAIRKLESNWKTIRDEGLSIMDEKSGGFVPEEENLREKGDWLQFTLYLQGRKLKNNCRKTPKTCAIMDSIPESTGCKRGQVKFSVMHPGTHIWPHTGPTNCRLRAHLGLVIPESVAIRVAETTGTWEEGKVVVIDDSIEHEVWHNGTSFRLILIADFWHPDLTLQQRAALSPI